MVESVSNRSKEIMLKFVKKTLEIVRERGLIVTEIRADQEFDCIRDDIIPIHSNLASPGEHVPEVERSIRTIKERARALFHDLPHKFLPKVMIEACIFNAVRLFNSIVYPPLV